MCLIFLSYRQHKKYPFILLANRDEFYDRPTEMADFWEDDSLLAGKDLEAGGTWLGINRGGRIAMLTNYRDLSNIKQNAPSRGKLVTNFLKGSVEPHKYLFALDQSGHLYNGYNIILGTVDDPWYYSNYQRRITRLGTGLYGLSNALLDTPWPKVRAGKERLDAVLANDVLDKEKLFDLMKNNEIADDEMLPDTGVGIDKERALSPFYIEMPGYGTRCTTLIMMDDLGRITFEERTTIPKAESRTYEFEITNPRSNG